ncbi:MAG: thioredoxin domain-containing protein [Oligoflexales bacterium]|nr:thioredoxin domain-containing protein [Oligoflexales bacterium]
MKQEFETSGEQLQTEPKGWRILQAILSSLGFLLSAYSSWHHLQVKIFGKTSSLCQINASISCDRVALSEYSEVLGIPLGFWGMGYYLALLGLLAAMTWGKKSWKQQFFAYSFLSAGSVLVSILLSVISWTKVLTLCIVCSALHLLNIIQFASVAHLCYRKSSRGIRLLSPASWWTSLPRSSIIALPLYFIPALLHPALKTYVEKISAGSSSVPGSPIPGSPDSEEHGAHPVLLSKVEQIPLSKTPYMGYGEDYRRGGDEAKVILTVFSDFQCPGCRNMSMLLAEMEKEFAQDILVVYRNFPLDKSCNPALQMGIHAFACEAALLARCAGQYGNFWAFHDKVFRNQKDISSNQLKEWAKESGLNDEQLNGCRQNQGLFEKIKDDIALANRLNVQATPTLYLNGQQFAGTEVEELKHEIRQRLKR